MNEEIRGFKLNYTKIKKNNLKIINYIIGILFEIIGFGLIFAFDKTMLILHSYKILFSLFIIISGYLIAVSMRK